MLIKIKSVEKLVKTNATTKSIELLPSCEWNIGNEVEINHDENLIFTTQKNNLQMKRTKKNWFFQIMHKIGNRNRCCD